MSTTPRRLVTAEPRDDDPDASLRPQRLADFIGQEKARANLDVFIQAARARTIAVAEMTKVFADIDVEQRIVEPVIVLASKVQAVKRAALLIRHNE